MGSDIALVRQTLAFKDKRAFGTLMLRHQQMVRGVLGRYCKDDSHLIEDLLQETFIRAYVSLNSFRADSSFSTWLYRIATNVVLDKLRRKDIDCRSIDADFDAIDSAADLHHFDLRRDLAKALGEISEAQKVAVRLCLQEGYSHADAARRMKIPLGTVKSHVARAKLQLQQLLLPWNRAV